LALVQAYTHWYGHLTNPLDVLISGVVMGNALQGPVVFLRVGTYFAIAALVLLLLLLVAYRRVGLAYWVLGMWLIVVPFGTGAGESGRRIGWAVCRFLATSLMWPDASQAKSAQEIDASVNAVLVRFMDQFKGAKELFQDAKGILVLTDVIQAGVVIGGQYGEG